MKNRLSIRTLEILSRKRQLINTAVAKDQTQNGTGGDYYFETEVEALAFCKQLAKEDKADLFRGQTHDWSKILPSIFRLNGSSDLRGSLAHFLGWARTVPQMAIYRSSTPALTAIAQHYGIPTRYLDLTTDPEVAFIFAKLTGIAIDSQQSVVYCWLEQDLQTLTSIAILRIDVANLWRLER